MSVITAHKQVSSLLRRSIVFALTAREPTRTYEFAFGPALRVVNALAVTADA
jgi:hypothetical protein